VLPACWFGLDNFDCVMHRLAQKAKLNAAFSQKPVELPKKLIY
jgi:hypothetical protein